MAERNICWISPQGLIAHIPLYVIASADIVNTKRAGPATSFFLEEEEKTSDTKYGWNFPLTPLVLVPTPTNVVIPVRIHGVRLNVSWGDRVNGLLPS